MYIFKEANMNSESCWSHCIVGKLTTTKTSSKANTYLAFIQLALYLYFKQLWEQTFLYAKIKIYRSARKIKVHTNEFLELHKNKIMKTFKYS